MTDSPLPHTPIAERSILSAAMRSPSWLSRIAADGITAESFYLPSTRAVWGVLRETSPRWFSVDGAGNDDFDLSGFIQHLATVGKIDSIGGPAEVVDIYGYAQTLGGYCNWLTQVREAEAHRRARALSAALAESSDAGEALYLATATLEAMRKTLHGSRKAIGGKEAAKAFLDAFKADHAAGDMPGTPTGIAAIDEISGGMRPGELWVIGGKPNRGKSVLMLQISANMIQAGKAVAIFSLEMMAREIVGRMISYLGRIFNDRITQPRRASQTDLAGIIRIGELIATSAIHIDDSAGMTAETICSESERIRDATGALDLIVVDYIQLIRGGRGQRESREEEVARASGALKQLAKRLRCPVITASQLNEDGKTRESRAIEQDADALLLIVDDGLMMHKMRNAKRGDVLPLELNGALQRFETR